MIKIKRMLSHILFKKSKQDVPDSCHKIMCDDVLPVEWSEKNTHLLSIHRRNTLFTCRVLSLGELT